MDLSAVGLVAIGGACGSVVRYLLQEGLARWDGGFSWGTLAANVIGSFAIGLLWPFAERFAPGVRPLVMVGFLGGFTTMSSYTLDVLKHAQSGRFADAAGYALLGAGLSVMAVMGGFALGVRLR